MTMATWFEKIAKSYARTAFAFRFVIGCVVVRAVVVSMGMQARYANMLHGCNKTITACMRKDR